MSPPKTGNSKSASVNGAESTPVSVNPRKPTSETSSIPESLRKASDDWIEYEQASKKVMKNKEVYARMDEYVLKYNEEKERADTNEKEKEKSEASRKLQLDDFTQKCNEWKEREEELEQEVEDAKRSSQNALSKEIASLKARLAATEKAKLSLETQLATTKRDCQEAKVESEVWRKKVERYDQDLAQLDDTSLETHEKEATDLRERSYSLFMAYFGVDISETLFTNYPEWQRSEIALELAFRLPATNSPAAKAVRLAASLYTYASSLNKISGRSWYNLSSSDDSEAIAEVLQSSFTGTIRKKNLARSLFLSISQRNDVQAAMRKAAKSASETVFEKLKFFIPGKEQMFRSDLDKLFQDWADFWLKVHYSQEQIEATIEEEDLKSTEAWLLMNEFGDENPMQGMGSQSVPLFPCLYSYSSSGTENIIQPGFSLFLDQEQVVSATKEANDMERSKKNMQRDHIRRRSGSIFAPSTLSNVGRLVAQANASS